MIRSRTKNDGRSVKYIYYSRGEGGRGKGINRDRIRSKVRNKVKIYYEIIGKKIVAGRKKEKLVTSPKTHLCLDFTPKTAVDGASTHCCNKTKKKEIISILLNDMH